MKPRAKQSIDYHGVLAPLDEACRFANVSIDCVTGLMAAPQIDRLDPRHPLNILLRKAGVAFRHLEFAAKVLCTDRRKRLLVREFSNVPLACVFPLLLRARRRLLFLNNQNLQWALDRTSERMAFKWLTEMGCRLVFLEEVPSAQLNAMGIDPSPFKAIPMPSSFRTDDTVFRERTACRTIGVIGQYRKEKGLDELLERLAPLSTRYRIILGLPNPADFERQSTFAGQSWFEHRNTSEMKNYLNAMADCDAVLVNHPVAGYQFRASGLIGDAASLHVPVVARSCPVLQHQLTYPVQVGESFGDLSELEACLQAVDRKLAAGDYDFETYNKARSAAELAKTIDAICNQRTTA